MEQVRWGTKMWILCRSTQRLPAPSASLGRSHLRSGDQSKRFVNVSIVRVDPFRTNVTQRQMRAVFDAKFWFRYFWVVLCHFQLHTSIISVVESIGSIRSMIRRFRDPLYETTCLMRQMRHAFDAFLSEAMRQKRAAFAA